MAHSRPKDVGNRGDLGRIVTAHGTCNQLLAADLRVQELYRDWVVAQDQHRRDGLPAWVQTKADVDRVVMAIREAEIDHVAGVLRSMGVPWRWCAEAMILAYFPTMRYNEGHPHDRHVLQVEAGVRGLPKGRMPRHRGRDVAEWVRWWYRRNIKQPPDALHELVDEYARRENRVTEAHSVVQNGIKAAENLLNLVITAK